MEHVWELLSDKGINTYLARVEAKLDEDALRLLLVGLLQRVQALEAQCFTLQSLLVTNNITTAEGLERLHRQAQDYLARKDSLREQEIRIMSSTGVTPLEWLNYVHRGKFKLDQ